jgi:hypothetical protein
LVVHATPQTGIITPAQKIIEIGESVQLNTSYSGDVQWQESADGLTFTDIKGATGLSLQVTPKAETHYRIKVGYKGCVTYSLAAQVIPGSRKLAIYPVPSKREVKLGLLSSTEEIADIQVYDAFGQMVMLLKDVQINKGRNEFSVDISLIAHGTYYVKIANTRILTENKFLKID